jgi:hypothetical protein
MVTRMKDLRDKNLFHCHLATDFLLTLACIKPSKHSKPRGTPSLASNCEAMMETATVQSFSRFFYLWLHLARITSLLLHICFASWPLCGDLARTDFATREDT